MTSWPAAPTSSMIVTTAAALDTVRSPEISSTADSRDSIDASSAVISVEATSAAEDLRVDTSDLTVSICAFTASVPSPGSSSAVRAERSLFSWSPSAQ